MVTASISLLRVYAVSMFVLRTFACSGDFAEDLPFDCPATTTCPVVCVSDVLNCPTVCEDGLNLCLSGHCAEDCTEFDTFENPCSCGDYIITCPKVADLFDTCFERFQTPYYDEVTVCEEAEEEAIPLLSWSGPWFVACYVGLAIVAVLLVGWCYFNQKIFPISNSMMPLMASMDNSAGSWSQTGYKTHPIGSFIFFLVTLSCVGIQVLMFYLDRKSTRLNSSHVD